MFAVSRAVAAGVACLSLAATAGAGPVAECAAPDCDFGTQTDEVVVRHVFRVANRGDAPLVLRVGRACCGAQVAVPVQAVPPGGSDEVRVDLTLRGRSGKVVKAVYVQTNDPAHAVLRFELRGRVIAIPGPPPA